MCYFFLLLQEFFLLSVNLFSSLVLSFHSCHILSLRDFDLMKESYCHDNSLIVSEQHLQSYDSSLASFIVHEQHSQSYSSSLIRKFWDYDNLLNNYQAISVLAWSAFHHLFIYCIRQLTCSLDSCFLSSSYNVLLSILYIVRFNKSLSRISVMMLKQHSDSASLH